MNRPAKPATTRFGIDADMLGLAKILVQIRPDVTYPGTRAASSKAAGSGHPIADPSTSDPVWTPETARREWLTITRLRQLGENRVAMLGPPAAVRGRPVALLLALLLSPQLRATSTASRVSAGGGLP